MALSKFASGDIKVGLTIEGYQDLINDLEIENILLKSGIRQPSLSFREICQELFEYLIVTSPYDTGKYRDSWRIEFNEGNTNIECVISNDVKDKKGVSYWLYIVYGAEHYKRLAVYRWPETDPARGIIHDVRKIVYKYQERIKSTLSQRFKR